MSKFSWKTYRGLDERVLDWSESKRVFKLFLWIVAVQVMFATVTTGMFFYQNPCISQEVLGWSYTVCTEDEYNQLF